MGYAGFLLLLLPQMLLILALILFAVSFAALYIMKAIVKLGTEEVANKKGSIMPLVFTAWGINVGALAVALIVMDIVSFSIPFFEIIHSEWAGITEHAYAPEIIYILCLALLHAALLLFSYFIFKKIILNRSKRIKIFIAFDISSALIWALFMCYASRIF